MRQRNHSLVHKDNSPSNYSANPAGIGKRKEAEMTAAATMEKFFLEVDSVKKSIKEIEEATAKLHKIKDQSLMSTNENQENRLHAQLQQILETTEQKINQAKTRMDVVMSQHTSKLELTPSDIRTHNVTCIEVQNELDQATDEYRRAQQQYDNDMKIKAKRQILMVKPDATDEEIEKIRTSADGRKELFRQMILAGGVQNKKKPSPSASAETTPEHNHGGTAKTTKHDRPSPSADSLTTDDDQPATFACTDFDWCQNFCAGTAPYD